MSENTTTPEAAVPAPGATVVVEAATAEEALTRVHERLGPDARIVEAGRVRRGGVAGFFAREVVEMHAAPADVPADAGARAVDGPRLPDAAGVPDGPGASAGASAPIDRVLAEARTASEATDFASFLRQQLGAAQAPPADDDPSGRAASPAPVVWAATTTDRLAAEAATPVEEGEVSGPVEEGDARVDDGGPAWSATALIRLGLPPELVRSIQLVEPGDDVAWTYGLASVLRPLCRPLPVGRTLLVGPCAKGLAKQLGITVVSVGGPLRARGDIAAAVGAGAASRDWLERAGRSRWLHLVAGGTRWRELLDADPLAISWARSADLTEAVRCSYELGLVLGHGPLGDGVRRARPLDVALAVRDLVPRR